MRRILALGTLAILSSTSAACVAEHPAPRAPARVEPRIADAPTSPPKVGHGRLVLDAEGGPAWVSRVTKDEAALEEDDSSMLPIRSYERLCLTPCVVDLRQGTHLLQFSRRYDAERSSDADVVVTSKTTVVRHALGRAPRHNPAYVSGSMLTLVGGGMVLMGMITTAIGASTRDTSTYANGGDLADRNAYMSVGLLTLGVGMASAAAGLLLLMNNRPDVQPGATTTWTR
jgi:hypothetical protein